MKCLQTRSSVLPWEDRVIASLQTELRYHVNEVYFPCVRHLSQTRRSRMNCHTDEDRYLMCRPWTVNIMRDSRAGVAECSRSTLRADAFWLLCEQKDSRGRGKQSWTKLCCNWSCALGGAPWELREEREWSASPCKTSENSCPRRPHTMPQMHSNILSATFSGSTPQLRRCDCSSDKCLQRQGGHMSVQNVPR